MGIHACVEHWTCVVECICSKNWIFGGTVNDGDDEMWTLSFLKK